MRRKIQYSNSDSEDDDQKKVNKDQEAMGRSQRLVDSNFVESNRVSINQQLRCSPEQIVNQDQEAMGRSQRLVDSNFVESNRVSINQQLRCSSKQIFIFLGVNDDSKEINVNLISGDQRKKNQYPIILEDSLAIIKYPIDEQLDLQKKIALWNEINHLVNDRQLTFALILDYKQLIKSKQYLNSYLQIQFFSLCGSVSDFNLLLELKILAIIVSFEAKYQNECNEDELILRNMIQLKEIIFQIYWEQKKEERGYRQFLFYLIQIFSSQESFLKLFQEVKQNDKFLTLLQEYQSVDPKDLMVKPPSDIQKKIIQDLVDKIMNLDMQEENFQLFKELFSQLSLEKQQINLQEIFSMRENINIQQIRQMIDQIKNNQTHLSQCLELLKQIKLIQNFEQHLSCYNLKSDLLNNNFIESIQDTLQHRQNSLNLEEMKDFLTIIIQFSDWNQKFQNQEKNLKELIGEQFNSTLKNLSDRNDTQTFSLLINNLEIILEIIKSTKRDEINVFFSNKTSEIKTILEELTQTCCQIIERKINQIQYSPNFKIIEKDLQYCLNLKTTLNILSSYEKIFEVIRFDIKNSLQEVEIKFLTLKKNLENIKQNTKNNPNLSRVLFQDKAITQLVYEMLGLEIILDDSQIQSSLIDSISRYQKSLNDAINTKAFNDQFITNFVDLEKNETILNNNLLETKKLQNNFKNYLNQFLEDYKKINSDDLDLQQKFRLRQEKVKLDNLKSLMKLKNEPKFLTELLNKLPSNIAK